MSNACDSPQTAQERIESQARQQHCLRRAVSVLGALFSVLTVAINLADVVTDTIVAVQFYREGHMTWFWLVLSSLLIAHVVYTILGAQALTRECLPCLDRKPAWLRYSVAFVFAQLMPFLSVLWPGLRRIQGMLLKCRRRWCGARINGTDTSEDDDGDVGDSNGVGETLPRRTGSCRPAATKAAQPAGGASSVASTAAQRPVSVSAQEELDTLASSSYMSEVMSSAALKEHLMKYGLFYVESAVEAAPQAIIQLLAITFLGRASPAQLVSLCCSLFSITSKAFIISQSYDVRLIVFKFALAAHDVFSTFYLFSTLVAQETHKDTSVARVGLSWLGYVWLCKTAAMLAYVVLSGIATVAYAIVQRKVRTAYQFTLGSIGVALVILVLLPAMLAFEAVKLSWLNFGLSVYGPSQKTWTAAAVLGRFTEPWHEWGWTRGHPRVRFLMRLIVQRDVDMKRSEGETNAILEWSRNRQQQQQPPAPAFGGARFRQQPALPSAERAQVVAASRSQGAKDAKARRKALEPISVLVADTGGAIKGFSLWRLYGAVDACFGTGEVRVFNLNFRTLHSCPKRSELLTFLWLVLGAVTMFGGQLISFAYPFVNAANQAGTHNMLQSTCFVAACVALGVAVLMSPFAVWSFVYARLLHNRIVGVGLVDVNLVAQAVADYHTPPYVGCLQETVPVPVLPAEVTAEVAGFLTAHDIGLGRLTIAECNAMKRRVAERHAFAIGTGDEDSDDNDGGDTSSGRLGEVALLGGRQSA